MLRSMTAYGRHTTNTQAGPFVWELRAVNHRHLDVSVRLPERFRRLEAAVRERLGVRVQRGKLEVSLSPAGVASATPSAMRLNTIALSAVLDAVQELRRRCPDTGAIDPLALLQWPEVLVVDTTSDPSIQQHVLGALDAALDDFMATRKREGSTIGEQLRERAQRLVDQVEQVRRVRPAVVARQRERLERRLADLGIQADPSRLEQELVFAAQRLDIDEELDRLQAHLAELHEVLVRDEPVGRRLDFLLQELNREANTLGAKSSDVDTTGASIEMKVLIEQMREQVQNLE